MIDVRQFFPWIIGVIVLISVFMCDSGAVEDSVSDVSESLEDFFRAAVDSAAEVADPLLDHLGGNDAAADPSSGTLLHLDCKNGKQYTTDTQTETYRQITTYWWTDAEVPGLDPSSAPHISAIGCEPEIWPTPDDSAGCPRDSTCSGNKIPTAMCRLAPSNFQLETGRVIVYCGSKSVIEYEDPALSDYATGMRYDSIHIRID